MRTLFNRLSLSSIRSRMLMIALLPALLTEFGLVAYFTSQSLTTAEDAMHARAADAARHLADTLPYALVSGDTAQMAALLKTETDTNRLSYARVTDAGGRLVASSGDTLHAAVLADHHRQRAEIRLPVADARNDSVLATRGAPVDGLLGRAEVGVSRAQINSFKRETLTHAALLMLAALLLTGALAWRLSRHLAGQLRHVGQVVERLACHDFTARAQLPAAGEVGALAAGVNTMADDLQAHRGELEQRIREATAHLAAKKDMAERAHHARSRFFAAASHDLRQPLHALSLFVAALKARNQQTEAQTLIENIEASTAALELLFNALLDISRLDAGTIEVHPVHFPLQKMLCDLEQQFGAVATERRLRLRFRPCDITLYSDPLLIERILVNLIANAIRYTDDGGGRGPARRRRRYCGWGWGSGCPGCARSAAGRCKA
jgi:signal transduction histidine kinase